LYLLNQHLLRKENERLKDITILRRINPQWREIRNRKRRNRDEVNDSEEEEENNNVMSRYDHKIETSLEGIEHLSKEKKEEREREMKENRNLNH